MDNVTITDSDGTNPGHINRVTLSDDSSRGYWDFEKEIMSRTNMVTVQFQTDADNNDYGWRLIWGEENFIFDKKNLFSTGLVRDGWRRSGVLMSPNFPKPYPTSFSSDNIIRVSPYNTILFHFTNFSLASSDYVRFSEWGADGVGWGGGGGQDVTQKLSGNSLPENVTSPHHVVHVNFFSDRFSAGNGWRLEWIEGKVTNYTKKRFDQQTI